MAKNIIGKYLFFLFVFSFLYSTKIVSAQIIDKDCNRTSVGFSPLIDMGAQDYYPNANHISREEGGLYGNGSNVPPAGHYQKAAEATAQIRPRNSQGNIDEANGKIGVVSLGMSNTTQVFSTFMNLANTAGSGKSGKVVLVDGAYNSQTAGRWAAPEGNFTFNPWQNLRDMVAQKGLSNQQVQVFWMKLTNANPAQPGREDHPVFALDLLNDMAVIVNKINSDFPNVQIIYVSSRTYGGYTLTTLSPEPSAYETAFAMRYLIEDQVNGGGRSGVTYTNSPVILWSAYLWADGTTTRSDGFTWTCDDVMKDGVHPSDLGRQKAADLLLNFFTTDPLAKAWFTGKPVTLSPSPPTSPPPTGPDSIGGDANNDGKVDGLDYVIWLNHYNQSAAGAANGDFNNSGKVDGLDYVIWLNNYNKTSSLSPTPTTVIKPTLTIPVSTLSLDLYGVKFGGSEDYQELASLGVMNPVTIVGTNSAINTVITAARNIRATYPDFKPILWQYPEGFSCSGINSAGTSFINHLNSNNYWNDILAIYGLHEPLGSIACSSLDQVVSVHNQIRQASGSKAKIFGKMYSDTSYKGMGYKDGICDYCAVMYHPYRANPKEFRKSQMLSDLERDLNIFKSVPPGVTLNKFTPYLCTINWPNSGAYGTGLYMPVPSEMLDGGSSILNYTSTQGHKADGLVWYTWGNNSTWTGLDQYNNDGQRSGRIDVISQVGKLL